MADKKISALTASSTPLAGTEVLPIVQGGSTVKVSVANLTAGRVVSASGAAVNATFKAWSVVNAYQVGTGASFGGGVGFADGFATCNSYYDGAAWRRIVAAGASQVALTPSTGLRFNIAGTGTADSTMTWTEVGSFSALADFTVNSGNVVIGTAGKGIDFSASTHGAGMTSELLNDYEEGTFTPSFTSTGATITHAVRSGMYTRVGRLVTASVYLQVSSATGTLTNPLFISNLPYASVSTGEYGFSAAIGVHQFSGITPSMFMGLNTTNISVYVNGTVTSATPAALAAGYYLATITYMTS